MKHKEEAVLLDTSFFLRFLNEKDPLYNNADGYFRYFINSDIVMYVSTISIAEYCIGGNIDELPLRNLRILPFNLDHATLAGKFGKIAFTKRREQKLIVSERNIIPNDIKLFAQAGSTISITSYLTSDKESQKIFNAIKSETDPGFKFIDLNKPYNEVFGVLDL